MTSENCVKKPIKQLKKGYLDEIVIRTLTKLEDKDYFLWVLNDYLIPAINDIEKTLDTSVESVLRWYIYTYAKMVFTNLPLNVPTLILPKNMTADITKEIRNLLSRYICESTATQEEVDTLLFYAIASRFFSPEDKLDSSIARYLDDVIMGFINGSVFVTYYPDRYSAIFCERK